MSTNPTPHEAIRRHVEGAQDWEWREIATTLYQWTDRFQDRFFEHQMPKALLSFERMDVRILAAYTLRRNPQGLLYEITFNTQHLARPLWETLETLMHESVHLWQQNLGEHPVAHSYHNREFVGRCESLGLHPAIGSGVHTRPADGPFAAFLKAYGVEQPLVESGMLVDGKGKPLDWWARPRNRERHGAAMLTRWACGCQSVRMGKREFFACCTRCGREFVKLDGQLPPPDARSGEPRPPFDQRRFDLEGNSTKQEAEQENTDLQPRTKP